MRIRLNICRALLPLLLLIGGCSGPSTVQELRPTLSQAAILNASRSLVASTFNNDSDFASHYGGLWSGFIIIGGNGYYGTAMVTGTGWSVIRANGKTLTDWSIKDVVFTSATAWSGTIQNMSDGTQLSIYGDTRTPGFQATILPPTLSLQSVQDGTATPSSSELAGIGRLSMTSVYIAPQPVSYSQAMTAARSLIEGISGSSVTVSYDQNGNFALAFLNCKITGGAAISQDLSQTLEISLAAKGPACVHEGAFSGIARQLSTVGTFRFILTDGNALYAGTD